MIRIVTRSRWQQTLADRDQAHARAVAVQQQADRSYAGHVRSALVLAEEKQAAERAAQTAREEATHLREQMEEAAEQLAVHLRAPRKVFVLQHYGDLHSVHPTNAAAEQAAAVATGVPSLTFSPASDVPARDLRWRITPLTMAAAGAEGGAS
ncbi:hypothetical protein ACFV3R_15005 [Streptomyces sp. NPDC059740]|uniref:hypothetical protein n=1 Tax=Streptomyces sp. NPDC059740 TaxID=3346926 RepID=UPI00365D7BC3